MQPSSNMKAVLVLAENKKLHYLVMPALNIERDYIDWNRFGYHGQSHGIQAALSWAYCLFCDEVPPVEWNYRDPFSAFFSMDRDLQESVFKAMAIRHGFLSIKLEDRPKSNFQILVEEFGEEMEKQERRKGLKVVGSKQGLTAKVEELLRNARNGLAVSHKEIEHFEKCYSRGDLNGEPLEVHNDFYNMLKELKAFSSK